MSSKLHFYPSPNDELYNLECESVLGYCQGKGIDVGCGDRSIQKGMFRVDIDKEHKPDLVSDGLVINVEDEKFDYVLSHHSLEHMADQKKALIEWARILKKDGVIVVIHPDVDFTGKQKPQNLDIPYEKYNVHTAERTLKEFVEWFESLSLANLRLLDSGVAGPNWSFYAIIQKI